MRVLGVDYGSVRIGLALSDPGGMIAMPLETLKNTGVRKAARLTAKKADEHSVELIVVGLPLLLSGKEGAAAQAVRTYIEQLSRRTSTSIRTWDERFTTRAAEQAFEEAGLDSRARRGKLDPVAACFMLQNFLDSL